MSLPTLSHPILVRGPQLRAPIPGRHHPDTVCQGQVIPGPRIGEQLLDEGLDQGMTGLIGIQMPQDGGAGQTLVLEMCRLLLGLDYSPARMQFMREEPPCRSRFYEYFRCPVDFSAETNRLLLYKAGLHTPLPGANADLARVNEQVIHDYLARFNDTSIAMLVRAKLIDRLPAGDASEERIAEALHTSVRSLQRHLKEEGTSYKQVLDAMRQDLAGSYLDNAGYSINEVAYLLGFSEPGNFSCAFKRWYGVPPPTYRAEAKEVRSAGIYRPCAVTPTHFEPRTVIVTQSIESPFSDH